MNILYHDRKHLLSRERQRRYRFAHPKPIVRKFLTPEERVQYTRMNARRWQEANPDRKKSIEEKWRKNNPERLRVLTARASKRWRDKHPDAMAEIWARRRAAKRKPDGIPVAVRLVYTKAREYGFEVDHIVPLIHPLRCGLRVLAHLQIRNRDLNRAKRNKEWPDMP